ncbi:hypothetical protein PY093_19105 [Cytobacillus sp. S13-E01]|uniref:hypothetical protein n=1 Tax=Cytobacillus sp. S13-E01 TaxID=3031326 RepID=UPI0023D86476|nr:hypothetical protein [Cytobacillus sp. S13-E01]MDF0728732.1 hypothetical protein [Cytobacillus sp. S13-E01]
MLINQELIVKKKKGKLIEQILNHQVSGEAYIKPPSRQWKEITLRNFNKVHRGELSIEQLYTLLLNNKVEFYQDFSLVQYPLKEMLVYIGKVSNKEIEFN